MGNQQIDWGSVAVNVISALAQAYYREYETSTALYEMKVGARILTALMAQEDPEEAFLREFGGSPPTSQQQRLDPRLDPKTEQILSDPRINPELVARARFIVTWLREGGVDARIDCGVCGMRNAAQQLDRVAAGKSHVSIGPHMSGGALDVRIYRNGTYLDGTTISSSALYGPYGILVEGNGLVWAGRWTSIREWGHMEIPNVSYVEMYRRYTRGLDVWTGQPVSP